MRRYMPSVAPITIIGTAGTPGQSALVTPRIAAITSSRIGDGGAPWASPSAVRCTAVSASTRASVAVT